MNDDASDTSVTVDSADEPPLAHMNHEFWAAYGLYYARSVAGELGLVLDELEADQ